MSAASGVAAAWREHSDDLRSSIARLEAILLRTSEERDVLISHVRKAADRFEARAARCLHGNPNEWMEGEAKGNRDAAQLLRRILDGLDPAPPGATQTNTESSPSVQPE